MDKRKRIAQIRLEETLKGETETHKTLRAVVKRVKEAVSDFETARADLAATGKFTADGIDDALARHYEKNVKPVFTTLLNDVITPRVETLDSSLAALPQPTMVEVTDDDRRMYLERFKEDKAGATKAALTNRSLAAVLATADPFFTGLSEDMRDRFASIATDFPAGDKHEALTTQRAAADAVTTFIHSTMTEMGDHDAANQAA